LRGKGRDQQFANLVPVTSKPSEFPSPCGEKVGINRVPTWHGETASLPFPSPCGEKVGINSNFAETQSALTMFPSPCGEKVGINFHIGIAG